MVQMNFTTSNANTALTLVGTTTGWSGMVSIPGAQKCGIISATATRPTGMPATNPSGTAVCW